MTYIALSITTLLTIFFGVAYNEQKLKTERYRKLSNELFNKLVKKDMEGTFMEKYADSFNFNMF